MILPSDLTLYYNLRILCFFHTNSINIISLAGIENNKYFKCVEFFNLNEKNKIGFIISKLNNKQENKYIILNKYLYNIQIDQADILDISKIDYEYNFTMTQLENNNNNLIEEKKLKKLYVTKPIYSLKRNFSNNYDQWNFTNIFDEYFCFCKGSNCLNIEISQICKYQFYLYLIDQNHHIYNKTDFLLMDFIFKKYTSADVYPIFEKMINRNIRAHYLTEREDLYEKYCYKNKYCDLVILVNANTYKINGDFLEKYFTMILKLKQVLSSVGVNIDYINNLFYIIDYITYICIGHGVSYFKYYLYDNYYGPNNFNKLLIPNSEKLFNVPIRYGWKYENLIRFNLPRWEKFNFLKESLNEEQKIKSNSIFIMFTFRELKAGKEISNDYINNIVDLLNNEQLINNLANKNITLYFSLHHTVMSLKEKFKFGRNIKYIYENDISECLSKINLLITDYSSIIFDVIYRKKPYIIYIPDANDSKINENYREVCYNLIKNFTNNDFGFENVFFELNSTLEKINYYIDNEFRLDNRLVKFYKEFNFPQGCFMDDFISSLLKL